MRSILSRQWLAAAAIALQAAAGAEGTLQERIDAAAPGETLLVEFGHFPGNLVIDKPLVLRGTGRPHIEGERRGTTIQILADDVTIDGFRISHSGLNLSRDDAAVHIRGNRAVIANNEIHDALHGVYVRAVSGVRVENNRIRGIEETALPNVGRVVVAGGESDLCAVSQDRRGNGLHFWNSKDHVITGNEISGTRDGIYFSFTRDSRIEGNKVTHCRYGLHYMYSDRNYVADNVFENNVAGAALMFSKEVLIHGNDFTNNRSPRAYGLAMHNVDASAIARNRFTGNRIGLYLQNSHVNTLRENVLDRNYVGFRLTSSSTNNTFALNRVGQNLHNIDLAGRENSNAWDSGGRGNRWASSAPVDLTGDGVSELPHHEIDLFGSSRERFPFIAFLAGSPAMRVLGYALRRAPPPGIHYVTDSRPLAGPAAMSDASKRARAGGREEAE